MIVDSTKIAVQQQLKQQKEAKKKKPQGLTLNSLMENFSQA